MTTIVSSRKKFVFIHIPKTAGTSIASILQPYADPLFLSSKFIRNGIGVIKQWSGIDIFAYTGKYILPVHATAHTLSQKMPNINFSDFFRFSVVRNPWDILVSFYTFQKQPRKKIYAPIHYKSMDSLSFAEFVESYCEKSPKIRLTGFSLTRVLA